MQNRAARKSKYKMTNFDDITNKKKQAIIQRGHIFQIISTKYLITGSGSGKTNVLLNLISNQPDIGKKISIFKTSI